MAVEEGSSPLQGTPSRERVAWFRLPACQVHLSVHVESWRLGNGLARGVLHRVLLTICQIRQCDKLSQLTSRPSDRWWGPQIHGLLRTEVYVSQSAAKTGRWLFTRHTSWCSCGPHRSTSSIVDGQYSHLVCRSMAKKYSLACRAWSRLRRAPIYAIFSAWLEYTHDDVYGADASTQLACQERDLSFSSEFSEAPDPNVRQPVHWTLFGLPYLYNTPTDPNKLLLLVASPL